MSSPAARSLPHPPSLHQLVPVVDTHGRVGHKHKLPPITHPPGVDPDDTRVFPLEVSSPHEEVALGAGDCGHGLICSTWFILPGGWDENVEGWESGVVWMGDNKASRPKHR
jgi:hypothetical protein